MTNDWENILNKAKEETNIELVNKLKFLTNMDEEEIEKIAPNDIDKNKLSELLTVIKDVTKNNEEKNKILKNLIETSDIVTKLIGKLI